MSERTNMDTAERLVAKGVAIQLMTSSEWVQQLADRLADGGRVTAIDLDCVASKLSHLQRRLSSIEAKESAVGQEYPSIEKCPACNSPDPARHPSMSFEGEVELCTNRWHKPTATAILAKDKDLFDAAMGAVAASLPRPLCRS